MNVLLYYIKYKFKKNDIFPNEKRKYNTILIKRNLIILYYYIIMLQK